ncbi:putative membrane associated protein [Granulibacter bethesdensis]|uniref:Membrane associated protein n=2 Tax=Granulibacter bethesdensis TaxID=364410 RepID=A0AAN0RFX3_9PROT|nr:putative membrane associated protein [Granulibacter bethesdensis]
MAPKTRTQINELGSMNGVPQNEQHSVRDFHGLTADPFAPAHGPSLTASQQAAANEIAAAIQSVRPLIIIDGEAGTGRRTVLTAALSASSVSDVIEIANTLLLSGDQLRQQARTEEERAAGTGQQPPFILIFQTADTLQDAAQAALVDLLQERKGVFQAILIGGQGAGKALLDGPLGSLAEAERLHVTLPAPTALEMRDILRLAIEQAGQTLSSVMAPDAVELLLAQARFSPARLAGLTRQALVLAHERGIRPVDASIATMVAGRSLTAEKASGTTREPGLISPPMMLSIAVAVLALLSWWAAARYLPDLIRSGTPSSVSAPPVPAQPEKVQQTGMAATPEAPPPPPDRQPESKAAAEAPSITQPEPPPSSSGPANEYDDLPQPPHPYRLTRSGTIGEILLGTIDRDDDAAVEALLEVNPGLTRSARLPAGVILLMPSIWPDPLDAAPVPKSSSRPKRPRHPRPSWCDRAHPTTPASIAYVRQHCGR